MKVKRDRSSLIRLNLADLLWWHIKFTHTLGTRYDIVKLYRLVQYNKYFFFFFLRISVYTHNLRSTKRNGEMRLSKFSASLNASLSQIFWAHQFNYVFTISHLWCIQIMIYSVFYLLLDNIICFWQSCYQSMIYATIWQHVNIWICVWQLWSLREFCHLNP